MKKSKTITLNEMQVELLNIAIDWMPCGICTFSDKCVNNSLCDDLRSLIKCARVEDEKSKTKKRWCDTCWHRHKTSEQHPCNMCLTEGVDKHYDPIHKLELNVHAI